MSDVLQKLKEELPEGSLMVEVGCGKGDFVAYVQKDGYFDVKGFDVSYNGDDSAIKKRYLTPEDRIRADVVVLRHVLEHIPQPHSFLTMLLSVFGHSKIYIEVPNFDWIIENEAYFDITYEHVNYFSKIALQSLFQKHQKTTHGLLFDNQYQYVYSNLSLLNPKFESLYASTNWSHPTFNALFPKMAQKTEKNSETLKK